MTTATTKDVIDAIEADINTLALPVHQTFKYAKARSLRVDQGSWLQVYPATTSSDILSTSSAYNSWVRVAVEWSTPAFLGVESNVEDQSLAAAHLAVSDLITARLQTYGIGVPGLWNVTAEFDDVTYDLATGGVWEAIHTVRVELFEGV